MSKVLMKGNEAIGEAAIRAGCLNYFAYPITPQSEVAEYLSRRLPEVGGVFLQGESEVAVSYMLFGDYKLLVMAPASVQEAVEMVMTAFPLAEKYRNPVMILGDGLIGQMMEPVEFPDHLKTKPKNKNQWATNGLATRQSTERNLVKTLFLNPEELNDHNLKLKAKYERMEREEIRFEAYNLEKDYKMLIVSYGTMSRVCRTAIANLKLQGLEVGMIRPQHLFPFPQKGILQAAGKKSCEAILCVEMSMGQMIEDVERSVKGKRPVHWYGKCGGEVPSPEEVMDAVRELVELKIAA